MRAAASIKARPVARGRRPDQPRYDFARHLQHLSEVLPDRRPDDASLHAMIGPLIGRAGRPLGRRQFQDQLHGRENHHPRLPEHLTTMIPLLEFNVTSEHWLDFGAFKSRLPEPGRAVTSVQGLSVLLDEWKRQSPALQFSVVDLRRTGSDEMLGLRPGFHTVTYQTGFARAQSIHLLLLEHDEASREWLCLNAMAGFPDIVHGLPSSGQFETQISSQPGTCTMVLIAGRAAFDHRFQNIVRRVRELIDSGRQRDGALDKDVTETLRKLLTEEKEKSQAAAAPQRVVGSFRYRVW